MAIQLLYGDAAQLMKNMLGRSFDLVFADPVYTVDEEVDIDNPWLVDLQPWLRECYRLLKPNGSLLVAAKFLYLDQVIDEIMEAGFVRDNFKNLIVWHKTRYIDNAHSVSLADACEYIIWLTKGPNYYFDYLVTRSYLGKEHHNLIEMSSCNYQELVKDSGGNIVCKQQKPLKLMRFFVEAFSPPNGRVLDLFAGTGTTLMACRELGRHGVGVEKDLGVFRSANDRLYGGRG